MDPAAAMTRHTLTCTSQSIKLQLQPHSTAADTQILALNTLATPVPPMLWKEVSSGQMLRCSRPLPRIRPPTTPCGYLSLEAVTEHLGFSRRRASQRLHPSRDNAREPLACDVLSSMSSAGGLGHLGSSRLISALRSCRCERGDEVHMKAATSEEMTRCAQSRRRKPFSKHRPAYAFLKI